MAPTVADAEIWVNGGYYGGIYGFNQSDGSQRFFQGLGQVDGWTPAWSAGKVYSFVGGSLIEHHPQTGVALWSLNLSAIGGGATKTPVVDNGKAYICTGTSLLAIDIAARQLAWKASGPFAYFPAVANGMVYAISNTPVAAFSDTGQYL